MSTLLPAGVTSLADAPFTLHDAILGALRILSYETFPKNEQPPRHIWMDGDKLKAWFEGVERKRRKKYGIKDDEDDDGGEDGEFEENAAAMDLIKRG